MFKINCLFVSFILVFLSISQAASNKEIGVVMVKNGDASVTHQNKTANIQIGHKVYEGDLIQTQEESYVKIVMSDRNVIVVNEKSKFKFEIYTNETNNKKVKIDLSYGSLRHKLEQKYTKENESYEVQTSTAVAGVRGTDFITEFEENSGDSVVCTLEGEVNFDQINNGKRENNPQRVRAGDFIRHRRGEIRARVIQVAKEWRERKMKNLDLSRNFKNIKDKLSDEKKNKIRNKVRQIRRERR